MRDVNDFYTPRRAIIVDATALICMALAAVVSSMFVWDALASGFRTGRLERAFLIFLAVVLGGGALGGLLGLSLGKALAGRWEKRHRGRRPTVYSDERAGPSEQRPVFVPRPEIQGPGLRVRALTGTEVEDTAPEFAQHPSTRHQQTLVGFVDGKAAGILDLLATAESSVVLRLFVSPAYRRRGVGRALIDEARRHGTPVVFAHVPHDEAASAFLTSLGAKQGDAWTIQAG